MYSTCTYVTMQLMCSLVYAGIIYSTLRTFSLPLYTMSTSIIITIVIDPRSDTEQQQPYIYLVTVGKNNNSAVLQTWKSFRSRWSLRDIHRWKGLLQLTPADSSSSEERSSSPDDPVYMKRIKNAPITPN